MNLVKQSKIGVGIRVNRDEARHLLASLEKHDADLGETGRALQAALREAGIEPYREPEHRRYEY